MVKKGRGRNRSAFLNYIHHQGSGVISASPGTANRMNAIPYADLDDLIEALNSADDGLYSRVARYTVHAQTRNDSQHAFLMAWTLVQTKGTWTGTIDINDFKVHDCLEAAIDDEFAFRMVTPWRISNLCSDAIDADIAQVIHWKFDLPNDILDKLNAHLEIDADDHYVLGFIISNIATGAHNTSVFGDVDYTTVRRTLQRSI
jgi:hypothetical protein